MLCFTLPQNTAKPNIFCLFFSGFIEWEHWAKMGYKILKILTAKALIVLWVAIYEIK